MTVGVVIAACGDGGGDNQAYPTLQACFDDHHNSEGLTTTESISVCCLDHPINGVKPACGDTQTACEAIVRAGLDPIVTSTDIQAGCAEYITQKGQ